MYVYVGEAARKAALVRTGTDPGERVELALTDMSEADRQVLAAAAYTEGGQLTIRAPGAQDITASAVVAYLRQRAAEEAEAQQRLEAEAQQRRQEAEAEAARLLGLPEGAWLERRYRMGGPWYVAAPAGTDHMAIPGYAARREAETVEARHRNDAEYQAAEAKNAEGRHKAAEEKAKKLTWISDHGSERLRRLVAEGEGIRWGKVYRDERLTLERPGWAWKYEVCGDIEDARGSSITEEHLRRLDEARAVEPKAQLRWLGEGRHTSGCACPEDDYGEPQVEQRLILYAEDYLGYPILREVV